MRTSIFYFFFSYFFYFWKHRHKSTEKEAYAKIVFLPFEIAHKHSICPLLYSKTCKISTFIKGPCFPLFTSHLFIGLARGFCCKLEQYVVFFLFSCTSKIIVESIFFFILRKSSILLSAFFQIWSIIVHLLVLIQSLNTEPHKPSQMSFYCWIISFLHNSFCPFIFQSRSLNVNFNSSWGTWADIYLFTR